MSIAVYAGTFDPITTGHLYVIRRAAALFDHVVVLVAINPEKHPLFSPDERVDMIRDVVRRLPSVRADSATGLVVDYARDIGATALVRGVRTDEDTRHETQLAQLNWSLAPDIATIFLPAPPPVAAMSSSLLKRLAGQGADLSSYCSPEVAARLLARIGVAQR